MFHMIVYLYKQLFQLNCLLFLFLQVYNFIFIFDIVNSEIVEELMMKMGRGKKL